MSKVFFTADTHFSHRNILSYCSRDFPSIEEHDRVLLDNINSNVHIDDHLYILGDFCMGDPLRHLNQIKCRNLHFVVGSHDKQMWQYRDKFVEFKEKICTSLSGQFVVMTHCAHLVWERGHHGSAHAHGHSHSRLGNSREGVFTDEYQKALALIVSRAKMHDVGVDGHNFKPYSFDEFMAIIDKKQGFLVNRDRNSDS
jgi:calcineurin-like phosphoesterase family protein